jgi:hypothetical protein
VTKEFKELQGKGILGVVDGFLRAAISGDNFGESLKRLGEDIVYTTLKMIILQQLTKMFGLAGTGGSSVSPAFIGSSVGAIGVPGVGGHAFARGGVLENGINLKKYASGGIVPRPTVFPMANGAGLMGEAGPEAVLPLKRDSHGRLGVVAGGSSDGGVVVNVNNQTSTPIEADDVGISYDDMERLVIGIMLKDQARNGPVTRNYRR